MYFDQLCNIILEDVEENIHEKEERYLTWVVKAIVNQPQGAEPHKAAFNMFQRIFGFDPNRYKNNYVQNYDYYLLSPPYDYFSEQQIEEIEKIANIEYLSRFMGGNERINLFTLFVDTTTKFDVPIEKMIKIMRIVFRVVGQKLVDGGHKDWETLLFRLNLDKDVEQQWGRALNKL